LRKFWGECFCFCCSENRRREERRGEREEGGRKEGIDQDCDLLNDCLNMRIPALKRKLVL